MYRYTWYRGDRQNMRITRVETLQNVVRVIPVEDRDETPLLIRATHPYQAAILPESVLVVHLFSLLCLKMG